MIAKVLLSLILVTLAAYLASLVTDNRPKSRPATAAIAAVAAPHIQPSGSARRAAHIIPVSAYRFITFCSVIHQKSFTYFDLHWGRWISPQNYDSAIQNSTSAPKCSAPKWQPLKLVH